MARGADQKLFLGGRLKRLRRDLGLKTAAWWLYGPEEEHELADDAARYQYFFAMYPCSVPGVHHLPALAQAVQPRLGPQRQAGPHEIQRIVMGLRSGA